jgi:hypothetical protein
LNGRKNGRKNSMTTGTKLVVGALVLIAIGVIIGNMYTIVQPPNSFVFMKINNFTGDTQICVPVKGCYPLDGKPPQK